MCLRWCEKKIFFHDGENVETSFFLPKTTRHVYGKYVPTLNRPEKLAEAVLFSIQRYQLNRVVTIRLSKIEVPELKLALAEVEKSERFGPLFDRWAFGDVKKIFFSRRRKRGNFYTFFHLGGRDMSTENTSRLWIVPKSLRYQPNRVVTIRPSKIEIRTKQAGGGERTIRPSLPPASLRWCEKRFFSRPRKRGNFFT